MAISPATPDGADLVQLQIEPGVAVLTLNRPQSRNAVNSHLARRLGALVIAVENDPAVRVAILTGAGDLAICAGGDLKEMAAGSGQRPSTPGGGFAGFQLPRAVPLALEMLVTGEPIDARRALAAGLVNQLVEPGQALTRAMEIARLIRANAPGDRPALACHPGCPRRPARLCRRPARRLVRALATPPPNFKGPPR